MMLNAPLFDWLTLTTFEAKNNDAARMLFWDDDNSDAKRLQYKGVSYGSIFQGAAIQRGKDHYMLQASGETADGVAGAMHQNFGPYDWNVTRCDLQVTIPVPPAYDSRQLYDNLVAWPGPGKPRQISIIQSGDGNDTVYVGSRTSDRFTRIYVKPLDGGLRALRFEVEYKGAHAHRVFNDCRNPYLKGQILAHEVLSLPDAEIPPLRHFLTATGFFAHTPDVERVTGQNATLEWLMEQVGPTLERLCNDHEVGHLARDLLSSWYESNCHPDTKG